MVARLAGLLSILLLAPPIGAACFAVRRPQAVVVQQAILVPATFAVQAYGGSYGSQAQTTDQAILLRILELLERLEGRLDAPAGGHTMESVTKASCAACHTEGKEPKGGFFLFDAQGKPSDLSLGDKREIRRRITSRDAAFGMPPSRPLDLSRQAAILQALQK
jgi:hypothetical protein